MFALKPDLDRYQGKTIMIIGGHSAQEPAIRIAQVLGLKVAVVDHDPKAPGLQGVDYPLLISTTDVIACIEAAKALQIDGVMTVASDKGARTVAALSEALSLPGIPAEVAINATNKLSMRQIMADQQVPSPRFAVCKNYMEAVKALDVAGLPVVVKPLDSNSSLGVSVVYTMEELEKALKWAKSFSNSNYLLIEEYIPGEEVTTESFVYKGKVTVVAISAKDITPPPYCSCYSRTTPALISDQAKDLVEEIMIKAIQALGITNGPVHAEVRLSAEGPRFLELAPRLGGGRINSHLVPLATGINLIQATIDFSLGYQPDLQPRYQRGVCDREIVPPPGIVVEIPVLDKFTYPEVFFAELFIKPGDVAPVFHSLTSSSGAIMTLADTAQAAKDSAYRIGREIESKIVIK